MKWEKSPIANIVDRRHRVKAVAPTHHSTLLYGMPQTPEEMQIYKEMLKRRHEEYLVANGMHVPEKPLQTLPYPNIPVTGMDPGGVEFYRRRMAELERINEEDRLKAIKRNREGRKH
jgi:hypothetical protein